MTRDELQHLHDRYKQTGRYSHLVALADGVHRFLEDDERDQAAVKALTARAEAAEQAVQERNRLLAELTDPDPCWFDHNGGCQAHGFLSLEPGQTCPMNDAQGILRALDGGAS